MKKFLTVLASVICMSFVGAVHAVPVSIPGLFATGVDDSGNVLTPGSIDQHYTILETGGSAVTVLGYEGGALPTRTDSTWIWETMSGTPFATRTFRTTFDLSGFNLSTVVISGLWTADDFGGDIILNGKSTKQTCSYGMDCSFSLTDWFVDGINTLDFLVEDQNYLIFSAIRVGAISGFGEMKSAQVSEPAMGALLVLALSFGIPVTRRKNIFKN